MPPQTFVDTSYARIALLDSGGGGDPVVLIHGNSSCKEVFARQFEAEELSGLRLVALDLPGHGASADAADPARSYTIGGYAAMVEKCLARSASNGRSCSAGLSAGMSGSR